MFKAILSGLLKLITKLISLFLWPIDRVVETAFPTLSDAITTALNAINSIFDNLVWPLSILPNSFHSILIVIFTLEVAYITLFINVIIWPRLFRLIQKIKFW